MFARNLGYFFKGGTSPHPKAFQELIEKIKDTEMEMIISTVMLRTMKKAIYSHKNEGHFGLADKYYCHFTSPIRRYPDLTIHRIIKEYVNKKLNDRRIEYYEESLPELTRLCSDREQAAAEAERAVEDLKKAEYMKEKLGKEFEGVIAGVTSFGLFVELDNTIQGLVHIGDLVDDYYIFDQRHYTLYGERTGKVYTIGKKVSVIVSRADTATRKIDFVLSSNNNSVKNQESKKRAMKEKDKSRNKKDTTKGKDKEKGQAKAENKDKGQAKAQVKDKAKLKDKAKDNRGKATPKGSKKKGKLNSDKKKGREKSL